MTIIAGDSLYKLRDFQDNSIDVIYLDPPFFTQKNHALYSEEKDKIYSFSDKWDSLNDYIKFLEQILYECKRILKETGNLFLHCDKSASHYLKITLDNVFGVQNFRSEIIWAYRRWSNSKRGLLNTHQTIFYYSKSENYIFNTIFTNYSPTTNIDQILQLRERNKNGKSIYKKDVNGNVVITNNKKGVPLSDVWNIPFLNPKAKERVDYPTQKPILLLKRIIQISSNEGDIVLDPFCGSGTTLIAAKLLHRKYIGIDISKEAIELTKERLTNMVVSQSALVKNGEKDFLNKSDFELNILKQLDAIPVQRNTGIDGFLKENYMGFPISVKIQKECETIQESKRKLISASQSKKCKLMILIRTNSNSENFLFNDSNELEERADLIILDSYDFLIRKKIEDLKLEKVAKVHSL